MKTFTARTQDSIKTRFAQEFLRNSVPTLFPVLRCNGTSCASPKAHLRIDDPDIAKMYQASVYVMWHALPQFESPSLKPCCPVTHVELAHLESEAARGSKHLHLSDAHLLPIQLAVATQQKIALLLVYKGFGPHLCTVLAFAAAGPEKCHAPSSAMIAGCPA